MDIICENICKKYKEGQDNILNNICCVFSVGSLVTIVGKSGSGKSSFLRIIGGLDLNYSGSLKYGSNDVSSQNTKNMEKFISKIRREDIGYIFQDFKLLPAFSVYENLNIVLSLMRIPNKKRDEKIKKVLEKVDMLDNIYKYISELSGGEKQRVAIARALLKNVKILIADEPTGSLDNETSKKILEIFKKLNRGGITVIIVTHDPQIAKIGMYKYKMEDGNLIGN